MDEHGKGLEVSTVDSGEASLVVADFFLTFFYFNITRVVFFNITRADPTRVLDKALDLANR